MKSITIHTLPSINIGPATISINSGQTVTLDAGNGFASYLWSTSATTQTITTGIAGFYYVTVTDGNGCQAADSITISVLIGVEDIDHFIHQCSNILLGTEVGRFVFVEPNFIIVFLEIFSARL